MFVRILVATALILAAVAGARAGAGDVEAVPSAWTLKGVALFSRHGIRGPLDPALCDNAPDGEGACMDAISSRRWPTMGVVAGDLLQQGYDRVVTLARYYRQRFAAAGLLPEKGCPASDAVAVHSDNMERTVMTAGALMDGMFPGCSVSTITITEGIYLGPTCGYTDEKANAATLAYIGGSWAAVAKGELATPLGVMDETLGKFSAAGCTANGAVPPCRLATIPTTVTKPGAIEVADQPSEQFLMQYGAGFEAEAVAWGRLPEASGLPLPKAITEVNAVHAFYFRALYMPRYQAVKQGSPVMQDILDSLAAAANGKGPVLTIYSGHDDNILNVAGMLDLSWQLESYQPYQVPPGGAVAFELWDTGQGLRVRMVYIAQTIDQMRSNAPLSGANPPAEAVMPLPGCGGRAGTCSWGIFRDTAAAAIDKACVHPG